MPNEIVQYGEYTEAEATAVAETGARNNFFKMEAGKSRIRVLPPLLGKVALKVVSQHFVDVPGATRPIVFACPRILSQGKQRCIVCEKAQKLERSGSPADRDRANDLFPRRRVFANIIDRSRPDDGPLVYEFGKTVHEALAGLRNDQDAGGDFTNPYKGFDVIIERKGTGRMDTKYTVRAARQSTVLSEDSEQMNDWIKNQADLDTQARLLSDDDIRRRLSEAAGQQPEPSDADEDAPSKPQPQPQRSGGRVFDAGGRAKALGEPSNGRVLEAGAKDYARADDDDIPF